jgi:hypothetical protein
MNSYYLEVLNSGETIKAKVDADILGWSEAGLYEFVKYDANRQRQVVAYYPVSKTIISKIEYDVYEAIEQ